ncbi:MAG TPA: response regulator [Deltaproteobacteria bacterium]|nr:response regulator [Deltaproteobacteria bacterium]
MAAGFEEGEGTARAQLDVVPGRVPSRVSCGTLRLERREGHAGFSPSFHLSSIGFRSIRRDGSITRIRDADPSRSPRTTKKRDMTPSRTALIVDDEDPLLRLMARVLERAGYRVWTAADGVEAFRLFTEHVDEIDLVLLDVVHPPGGGAAELLPRLLERRPDLDVILTSGDSLPEALEETRASIGGRYLRKPFVPKTLLRMLEEGHGRDSGARLTGSGAA